MSPAEPLRIFMTGVGGQGTLTATRLLAETALAEGYEVTAGEIHGMAQRGGVVESFLCIGLKSPRIVAGEADVLLGFEPLETLRALPYLKPGGLAVSSIDPIPPIGVARGKEAYPDLEDVRRRVKACAGRSVFLPCQTLGLEAGAVQSGNTALLGAFLALGVLPFGPQALARTIEKGMKPKVAAVNLRALELGVSAAS